MDGTTVSRQLKENGSDIDDSYIDKIIEIVPTASHYQSYANLVVDASQRRDYIRISQEINSSAYDGTISVSELVDKAEKSISSLGSRQRAEAAFTSLSEAVVQRRKEVYELKANPDLLKAVSTGYTDLDHILVGGFKATDLILIGGQTSMGKSALGLAFARKAADANKPVMMVSLEMSTEQLVDRMLSAEANIGTERITTGRFMDKDGVKLDKATGVLEKLPIYIEEASSLTPSTLRHKAKIMVAKHGIELIIIDYLQLMKADGKEAEDGTVSEFTHISRRLKLLAKELKIPVIALAQLSRKVESREGNTPRLSDLRSSGSLEQDADVVMFVFRQDYQNVEEDTKLLQVRVQKQRNGPIGLGELWFDKTTQRIDNYRG